MTVPSAGGPSSFESQLAADFDPDRPADDPAAPMINVGQEPVSAPDRGIRVFVRKGAHNEQRIVSFTRPADIAPKELFDLGVAIDGTQATFAVSGDQFAKDRHTYHAPFIQGRWDGRLWLSKARSLPEALAEAEQGLVKFLEERGYTIEFA
jgi:hypothetical protein